MKEKEKKKKESLFTPASSCGLQAKSYTFQHWRHNSNAVVIVRNNKNKCISFVRLPSALTAVLPSCWPEQLGYCFGSPLALLFFFSCVEWKCRSKLYRCLARDVKTKLVQVAAESRGIPIDLRTQNSRNVQVAANKRAIISQ